MGGTHTRDTGGGKSAPHLLRVSARFLLPERTKTKNIVKHRLLGCINLRGLSRNVFVYLQFKREETGLKRKVGSVEKSLMVHCLDRHTHSRLAGISSIYLENNVQDYCPFWGIEERKFDISQNLRRRDVPFSALALQKNKYYCTENVADFLYF